MSNAVNKHTPGPWMTAGNMVYALMHSGWRKGIEQFKNRFSALVQGDRDCSQAELLANARLIAAAPELLAELSSARDREVLRLLSDAGKFGLAMSWPEYVEKYGTPPHVASMNAAIAKATGAAS